MTERVVARGDASPPELGISSGKFRSKLPVYTAHYACPSEFCSCHRTRRIDMPLARAAGHEDSVGRKDSVVRKDGANLEAHEGSNIDPGETAGTGPNKKRRRASDVEQPPSKRAKEESDESKFLYGINPHSSKTLSLERAAYA